MHPLITVMAMFSVLTPQKIWYAPPQPLSVTVKSDNPVTLTLTDFSQKSLATAPAAAGTVDLKQLFPAVAQPGTYFVYAGTPADFAGTPLVIEVRQDTRSGVPAGPMVTKVEPLCYAEMNTDMGKLTCDFYYDVAPNTVDNFLSLSEGGYYDGLIFHRIVPGFVIQGGDPRASDPTVAGTGGPGYSVGQEFNNRPHTEGVLSMARSSDPDSAGSQFFVCLDYHQTQQLDHQYTAFGKVVDGMDAVRKIAAVNVPDATTGRPDKPPVIQKVDVLPVTKEHNPYAGLN
jgi:cyclophilin family peptidyl-prolyl cis-trans isomerase